jgi:ribonuclease HI
VTLLHHEPAVAHLDLDLAGNLPRTRLRENRGRLSAGAHEKELFGGEAHTTNNRMELTAVIRALQSLKRPATVSLFTDSQYVKNGIESWIHGWRRNGWKTADKKPVKNEDLWRELEQAVARHEVTWHWVRGHADEADNVRADALANRGVETVLAS